MQKEQGISILDVPEHALTPGMRQYRDAKKENSDCLIMLRMGDFYEMFYEDALTAAKELEITLTARGKGEKRAPLAGIPYHALEPYLTKLVKKGHKVAIVEQLEDPKKAKGLLKRGCVRIVTPGTIIESSMLTDSENNYIAAITTHNQECALSFCDMSTGEFITTSHSSSQSLLNHLSRLSPQECIIPQSLAVNKDLLNDMQNQNIFVTTYNDLYFKIEHAKKTILQQFDLVSIDSLGITSLLCLQSSGALLAYLQETQKKTLTHINTLKSTSDQFMIIDSATFRNLEITKNMRDHSISGTLLKVLDHTKTSMGARNLRKWLKAPLQDPQRINARLEALENLTQDLILHEELIQTLKQVYDLERLIARVNYGTASPKDVLALKHSLEQLPIISNHLAKAPSTLLQSIQDLPDLTPIHSLLESAIKQDAPLTIREGNIIKASFNQELQEILHVQKNATNLLAQIEIKEKEKTSISALKISYNRVFGYFLEVTKKNIHLVPDHYIRKQTTANAERYITQELKELEHKILSAKEKSTDLEYQLFQEIIHSITKVTKPIQEAAKKIAVLDTLLSLSTAAMHNNYTKPLFTQQNILHLQGARHPVIETTQDRFIPNDIILEDGEVMIITGPNMAGKSTIMRQAALITLMAHIGSFVPAISCTLGITDRIFTRVGASDNLSQGQSTFMVEMSETASILNNATPRSLIILDEIGRGTSTFDGVSIAWSVAEYIHNTIKAKTLFATHYHVLNKLAASLNRVKNFNIAVKEQHGQIIFLHKLIQGGTDQSYGVHVARLAGVPSPVLERAKEIQHLLEQDDEMIKKIKVKKLEAQLDLSKF